MNQFLSLHIGVNAVDNRSYGKTKPPRLLGCVNDACAMTNLALAQGYDVMAMLADREATYDVVTAHLEYAVNVLREGDQFLLTFSGHGARMLATSGDPDEPDKYDEGFMLSDLIMKDNYLSPYLRRFKPGVRVIFVADCCHSRTLHSLGMEPDKPSGKSGATDNNADPSRLNRRVIIDNGTDVHQSQRERYTALDRELSEKREAIPKNIQADIIMLTACDDNERAADGPVHGLFTQSLLDVLRSGAGSDGIPFTGSYKGLIDAVASKTGSAQVPGALPLGPNACNPSYPFFQGPPFTIHIKHYE